MIKNIPPEKFVSVWEDSETVQQVSEKTGLNYGAVHMRYKRYLAAGIPLSRKRNPISLDVGKLTGIINETNNKKDKQYLWEQFRCAHCKEMHTVLKR